MDTRIPLPDSPAEPLWSGVAEIWLENETEQLASLQAPEFLEGAQADEPRWAAFWRTLVMDTDVHVLVEGPPCSREERGSRCSSWPSGGPDCRSWTSGPPASAVRPTSCPSFRGFAATCRVTGPTPPTPSARPRSRRPFRLWFDDVDSLVAALASPEFERVAKVLEAVAEPRYVHRLVVREHWTIGPELR